MYVFTVSSVFTVAFLLCKVILDFKFVVVCVVHFNKFFGWLFYEAIDPLGRVCPCAWKNVENTFVFTEVE